jgi:glycosidase
MKKICVFLLPLFLLAAGTACAQQVLMQGWYWDYPKTSDGKSWADTLRLKAAALKQAGITHIWFPPHTIASFGPGSNGYDPKDLFIGNQTSGLGTRTALNNMLAEFTAQGIAPVADMVYNHRDGGSPEVNPPVKDYITNHYTAAKEPFPSDRFRCIIPLGGSSGNGAGDYYIKISSKTQDGRFFNAGYKLYMETKTTGWQGLGAQNESEPNGGGDCGAGFNNTQLGRDMLATVDGVGCKTDEFKLTISSSDYNAAGDTLYIYLNNTGSTYSDHRIYGIWSTGRSMDIVNDVLYQTYTNFSNMPSGRGQMNYEFFKPNSSNASSTYLSGDWDGMYFFYDYDQFQQRTRDTLTNWTKWNWTDLGVRGFRMDAVKHFSPQFVGDLLDDLHAAGMDPSMVVGEWYGTNTAELSGWVNNVKAAMNAGTLAAVQPKIFDFSLRDNLRQACDESGFDVRNVFNGSLRDAAGMSGFNVVTFVNNHDFRDASGFASLIRNDPKLAYAYILTNNQLGVPTVFYPDYYGYPAPSGGLYSYHPAVAPMTNDINRLMTALSNYIDGSPSVDYLNRFSTPYSSNFISGTSDKALIYQLQGFAGNGNKDVIVAINFSSNRLQVDHGINTRGGTLGTGTRFTDVMGNSAHPYALVNSSGQVYVDLPARSFSVWVQGTETVLPLRLMQFSAEVVRKTVALKWDVEQNRDAQSFDVERSVDGSGFKKIGTVAVQNDADRMQYSFTDLTPKVNVGMMYRLKITGKDGRTTYSDIKPVRIDQATAKLTLQQNPVREELDLLLSLPESDRISLVVFSSTGQELSRKSLQFDAGTHKVSLPVRELSSGLYRLVFQSTDGQQVVQFMKK